MTYRRGEARACAGAGVCQEAVMGGVASWARCEEKVGVLTVKACKSGSPLPLHLWACSAESGAGTPLSHLSCI